MTLVLAMLTILVTVPAQCNQFQPASLLMWRIDFKFKLKAQIWPMSRPHTFVWNSHRRISFAIETLIWIDTGIWIELVKIQKCPRSFELCMCQESPNLKFITMHESKILVETIQWPLEAWKCWCKAQNLGSSLNSRHYIWTLPRSWIQNLRQMAMNVSY